MKAIQLAAQYRKYWNRLTDGYLPHLASNALQSPSDQPIPELPALEAGVTILESTKSGPLQTLVFDHVLLERENA
ncbi:hypothetical protein SAMN04487967_3628 [Natronorubrum sediminis]|uniref:Uncharacterized protein n=1 Tax=Natronorubrum sediminis TaxID=640943 RepID=A0A1H6G696_9EURY|nr:hypothetical protein SAMN04487967_3628 [Natronorubrum sediminis]